jgi:hypothetical protein
MMLAKEMATAAHSVPGTGSLLSGNSNTLGVPSVMKGSAASRPTKPTLMMVVRFWKAPPQTVPTMLMPASVRITAIGKPISNDAPSHASSNGPGPDQFASCSLVRGAV